MSDMGMGGAPPSGGGMPPKTPLNPSDLGGMVGDGSVGPDMSVKQWFEKMGVDVNEPMSSAMEKIKSAAGGATGLGKAAQMGAPGGMPPAAGGMPPEEPQGLAGLM